MLNRGQPAGDMSVRLFGGDEEKLALNQRGQAAKIIGVKL